jgi:hypothetical protein
MTSGESIFNTHTEQVEASPAIAWVVFLDRAQWMDSFGSRRLVSGTDNMPGAIAEVTMAIAGSPVRQEETLFCAEARRLVVRITAAGTAMAAHADFQFDPTGAGCRVQASIHSWMPGSTAEERVRMHELTQEKIAADFARLREVLRGAR